MHPLNNGGAPPWDFLSKYAWFYTKKTLETAGNPVISRVFCRFIAVFNQDIFP